MTCRSFRLALLRFADNSLISRGNFAYLPNRIMQSDLDRFWTGLLEAELIRKIS
jgi:hypothetical protein